jgi:predicted outer membrane repeat protein
MGVRENEMFNVRIFPRLTILFVLILSLCWVGSTQAAGVVSTCDEPSLVAALTGGGLVTFTCSGTIPITAQISLFNNTTIDATGQNVILDGGGTSPIFFFGSSAGTLEIDNLTIQNSRGSAISIGNFDTVIINNSSFIGNAQWLGGAGAIHMNLDGTLTINNSTFANNSAPTSGSAIETSSATFINNSTFTNNSAGTNGAAIVNGINAVTTITNTTFTGNTAGGNGGAIVNYGTLTLNGTTLSGNTAAAGAAIWNATYGFVNSGGNAYVNNGCAGTINDTGGNSETNSPGCVTYPTSSAPSPVVVSLPPPPTCEELHDTSFTIPPGLYCYVLMRNGAWTRIQGTVPESIVLLGVIIAVDVMYYDYPGHAAQNFPNDQYQRICLQGSGRFLYADIRNMPRTYATLQTEIQGEYLCAWVAAPGTVALVEH